MYINMHGDVNTQIMGWEAMNRFEDLNTESGLVFLVWSEVSMIELNQYHASEYNQNYYIWFLQRNSEFAAHDWG